jgi:uncharacterized protein
LATDTTGSPDDGSAPHVDPRFEAFARICDTLAAFDGEGDLSFVDGYLTAVAASRRSISTDDWLPRVGGEAFDRAFADPPAVAEATQALEAWLTLRRAELEPGRLLDHPDQVFLTPLFDEWTEEDRQAILAKGEADADMVSSLQSGSLWAAGFMAAVEDFAEDWPSPDEADDSPQAEGYRAMTQLIACLTLGPNDETFRAFAAEQWQGELPTREELLNEACYAVQDLRVYWLDHGPKPEQRRVAPAPGRNDPCPCGSGLKFKKCHGASA